MSTVPKNMVELVRLLETFQDSPYANLNPLLRDGFCLLGRNDSSRSVSVRNVNIELVEERNNIAYGLDTECVVIPRTQDSSICSFEIDEESFDQIAGGYEGGFILEFGLNNTCDKIWIHNLCIVGMTRSVHRMTYEVHMLFDRGDVYLQTDKQMKRILMFKDTLDLLDGLELEEE